MFVKRKIIFSNSPLKTAGDLCITNSKLTMIKKFLLLLFFAIYSTGFSQKTTISGIVKDVNSAPIEFVNVLLFETEGKTPIKGVVTEENGSFLLEVPEEKSYKLQFSFIGFKSVTKQISPPYSFLNIQFEEDAEALEETVVTAKKPVIKKEAGKLVFNVENSSFATGSTMSLLSKTPGVIIIGKAISIKNTPATVYINGKRVYLSPQEVSSLLESLDASVVKQVEVITNPSAKYDAESGAILNIVTSRAVSIGYKGSLSHTYEQGIFPKHLTTTSHFYKNSWVNLFGSYSYSNRKENKQDESYITFFNPDNTKNSFWENNFRKITRLQTHQTNIVADFTINDKNSLNLSVSGFLTPDKSFENVMSGTILNNQQQTDSTYNALSNVVYDTKNLTVNASHGLKIGKKGANLNTSFNYIFYKNTQNQNVVTQYLAANQAPLSNNEFLTNAQQNTNIYIAQTDFTAPFYKGTIESGLKYSSVNTTSGIDFFNILNNTSQANPQLSDLFDYTESIFAGYVNFSRDWDKWALTFGVRAENTDVTGDSKSLGVVNTQNYLKWFPSASLTRVLKNGNPLELSYKRSLTRPRYQSLNPFKYFVNETFISEGNPNLVPSIRDKVTLSYTHKNKWIFEFYYDNVSNPLTLSSFIDNENQTSQQLDINSIYNYQYSFDVTYLGFITSWWYSQVATSTYYMENKFFAIKSTPETYTNNTLGFFSNVFNRFYLTKDRKFSIDVTYYYLSNMLAGTLEYKNQNRLNISFYKSLWNKRASLIVGVDDVFNTMNIPVTVNYYNQDFWYFPKEENRLFRVTFKYNFGNARLRDNNRNSTTDEGDRLK